MEIFKNYARQNIANAPFVEGESFENCNFTQGTPYTIVDLQNLTMSFRTCNFTNCKLVNDSNCTFTDCNFGQINFDEVI